MKTLASIQKAIDTVVAEKFTTTKTVIKHSTDTQSTRVYAEHLHTGDMQAIMSLVETIEMLNPNRRVFWMTNPKEVYNDGDAEALGIDWMKSTKMCIDIFIMYEVKSKSK